MAKGLPARHRLRPWPRLSCALVRMVMSRYCSQYSRIKPSLGTMAYTRNNAVARKAGGVCMKSVVLMFIGGLTGGLIGPVSALVGVAAGYVVGRMLTHSDTPDQKAASQ